MEGGEGDREGGGEGDKGTSCGSDGVDWDHVSFN